MSFSPNTAQSREISELRNHLKWIDEERRKTTRKMTELEQKLAQQGRELVEREQRIQDLEWHITQLVERLDQMPNTIAAGADLDQRLQMMEAQIGGNIAQLNQRVTSFQDSLANLTSQLRERTVSLAAESQTNLNALATSLQEHFEKRLAGTESKLDELSGLSTSVKSQVVDQIAELQADLIAQMKERLDAILADSETKIAQVTAEVNRMGNARELMVLITKMENDLELREAEEVRLANLINAQETRLAPLATNFEALQERTAILNERLAEVEDLATQLQKAVQDYTENGKPLLIETNRRISSLQERLTALNNNYLKIEATLQSLTGDQVDIREAIAGLADDSHRIQEALAGQLETWQTTIDEQKETVERFSQQWIGLSNQYKEARMAVQNLAHWQKQLEQQKREASEMLRVESNRMQSRWDGFMQEVQNRLKAFELDLNQKLHTIELENEQKWTTARRSEQLWREEIASIEELILKLQQDNRNMLLRVQNAQANAIKKWPRLLMEEVEKVVDINPNRRLSSPSTPPARSEISVVDAIEQGLIKVDYVDDVETDDES